MNLIEYLILFLISYLCGSFPSGYILVKGAQKKDLRLEGSGNVGALNALRVSKNKIIALLVLLADLFKGVLPALLLKQLFPPADLFLLLVVAGVLIGHAFPVWLKFKGGRGLAVVAGALLVLQPLIVLIWLIIWSVFFVIIRRHIVASMIATFIIPLIVFFCRDTYFSAETLLMILPVCLIIFERHLERLPDIVREKRISIKNGEV